MKEDFLVINHNIILRKLYLKCNTLFLISEYYIQKNKKKLLNNILQENSKLNKYLDNKTNIIENTKNEENNNENDIKKEENDIKKEENDIKKEENNNESNSENNNESNSENNSENDIKILDINTEDIQKKIEIIFSPRNDITVEIERVEYEEMDENANRKCKEGCNLCYNGCDLFFTGINFVCSFINHYMNKFSTKLKKCFNK